MMMPATKREIMELIQVLNPQASFLAIYFLLTTTEDSCYIYLVCVL